MTYESPEDDTIHQECRSKRHKGFAVRPQPMGSRQKNIKLTDY